MRADNENRKYLSNTITDADISTWDFKNIMIDSPTGSGKTTFVLENLYTYAKSMGRKILILEPRTDLVKDLKDKIQRKNKTDVISIMTFHKLEAHNYDLESYFYIVVDECHYFLHDSGVNKTTDISYLKLLQATATKIYMSGTAARIKKYMQQYDNVEFLEYNLPTKSAVSNVWFYDKAESLDWLVATALQQGYKSIFFINDLEKAVELYKKFKDQSIFCCSKWQKKYAKYRNEKEISNMLRTGTLGEKSILITTTTLDVGVSIIDREIRTIVIHGIDDLSTIMQCFGRKRQIDNSDTAAVYIQKPDNMTIGGRLSSLQQARKRAITLLNNSEEKYIKAYKRFEADEHRIVYDIWDNDKRKLTKHVNQVRLYNTECQIADYKRLLDNKPDGFRKVVTEEFGKEEFIKLDDEKENALSKYLEGLYKSGEKFLDKSAHDKLAEIINVNINGRLCKTIATINSALQNDLKLPFKIVSAATNRVIDGKLRKFKSAWHIEKI